MRTPKKIKVGDLILKEEPFVYALSSRVHSEYCDNCFRKGDLLKCSSCKWVYYCNKDCQREAWSIHKLECPCIKRVQPKVVPDAARLLARLIRKLQKGGDMIKSPYPNGSFRMFKDLMSHYSDLKDNKKRIEHFLSLYKVLEDFMGNDLIPNSAELMGMFGRMCVNSFNICDEEYVTLGTGIYLAASIIDHSCKPNAVAHFNGLTLSIRALEDMDYLDFTKIHISYIDLINPPKARQDELQFTYYFLCQCTKCLDPLEPIIMTSAACPNKKCNAYVNITSDKICPECSVKIEESFEQKFKEVVDLTAEQLKTMQSIAYLDSCKYCLDKQRGVLYKYNFYYVKTLDLAFQASLDFQQWSDAKEFGKDLIDCYRFYYGNLHPLLGLLYLKLGKIYVFENQSKEALPYLIEATKILHVTHGLCSPLVKNELMPLVQQAHMESAS